MFATLQAVMYRGDRHSRGRRRVWLTCLVAFCVGCGSLSAPPPLDAPYPAPTFALRDANPGSPTHGQVRSVADARGRVIVLYFASYSCSFCFEQFLLLDGLHKTWRREGLGETDVELWVVGQPGTEARIPIFASGSSAVCLADGTESGGQAYLSYGAAVDDLFLIDRAGQVRYGFNLLSYSLVNQSLRGLVDRWVRDLVAEPPS